MKEAVDRYGWRIGSYVVMRNHFHFAIQTPEPNLTAGMHWLQCTFATRFNRLRGEQGHIFQGRYRSILLQNNYVWARVNDYIHLNPVRAGIVPIEHVAQFRWSSLGEFIKNRKFNGLSSVGWLQTLDLEDSPDGWASYLDRLNNLVSQESTKTETERSELTRGWAFGDSDWKQSLVSDHLHVDQTINPGRDGRGLPVDMLESSWRIRLDAELANIGKTEKDLECSRKSVTWKIEIADRMQRHYGVSVTWLAKTLRMGKPGSVRAYLWQRRKNSQITT